MMQLSDLVSDVRLASQRAGRRCTFRCQRRICPSFTVSEFCSESDTDPAGVRGALNCPLWEKSFARLIVQKKNSADLQLEENNSLISHLFVACCEKAEVLAQIDVWNDTRRKVATEGRHCCQYPGGVGGPFVTSQRSFTLERRVLTLNTLNRRRRQKSV